MKITLAMVLALAMCFSMMACASSEDLDELNAVLDEASEELDALNEELDAELAEDEEEVVEEDAEEAVEEEVVEEDAEEAVEDAEAVEGDVIVSWEMVAAIDPDGNEVSAEDMGMTMVYMFNETVLEVAGVVNGEVAAVGTYEEAEDYVVITMDGEEAIGFMDGDYFVVGLADGTQQYCTLIETVVG